MIINESNEVILGNQGQTTKFQINASAKAFKILSSGLYKNKPRAIVRELICNIVDAHKLNGSTIPFQVKSPTTLDPRFVVRDFGPGLNEEDITNLYSTYFASTKSNSNDFIGALGLGSKSPFSYTETFTVVSYNGGKVIGYTAMLDSGEPILRKVFEEDMGPEDKTGIQITVPVKQADIQRWQQEIRYVLRTFKDHAHEVQGINKESIDYFPDRGNTEWFGKSLSYGSFESRGIYAIYGNIVYPLNDVPGLAKTWMSLNHDLVYVYFELGELDIAASREELSLDETTIENIIKRVDAISLKEMQSKIDELKSISNERELLREFNKLPSSAASVIIHSGAKINELTFAQLKEKYKPDNKKLADIGAVYAISVDTRLRYIKADNVYVSSRKGLSISNLFSVQCSSLNVMIDDKPSKRVKVIRSMAALPDSDPRKLTGQIVVYRQDDPAQMQAFEDLKELWGSDTINVIYSSKCDDIVADTAVKSEKSSEPRPKSPNVTTYTLGTNGYDQESFSMVSDELKDLDGLMILRKRDSFHLYPEQDDLVGFDSTDLEKLCEAFNVKTFHVVRSSVVDRLIKNDMGTSLIDHILEKAEILIKKVPSEAYIGNPAYGSRIFNVVRNHKNLGFILPYITSTKNDKDAILLNSISSNLGWRVGNSTHKINELSDILNANKKLANTRADKTLKTFKETYPMVSYVLDNCYSFTDDMINDMKSYFNNSDAE